MATQKLARVSLSQVVPAANLLLVPDRAVLPASFVEALKQGWKFAHDATCLSIDKRHRDGTVTLVRPGFSKLFVPYTASVKRGYSFGRPRLA